jgi:hypothetical protein
MLFIGTRTRDLSACSKVPQLTTACILLLTCKVFQIQILYFFNVHPPNNPYRTNMETQANSSSYTCEPRKRRYVLPKRWYPLTRPHGVTIKKTTISKSGQSFDGDDPQSTSIRPHQVPGLNRELLAWLVKHCEKHL